MYAYAIMLHSPSLSYLCPPICRRTCDPFIHAPCGPWLTCVTTGVWRVIATYRQPPIYLSFY